jgi:hypothetical protein
VPPTTLAPPSLAEQRAAIGLSTPGTAERDYLWSAITIPQANIAPANGGYRPHRVVDRAHKGPWRHVAIGGGLRGGKSLSASCEAIPWLPHSDLIWLAAETYDLCRQEFEYLAEAAVSLDWVADIIMPKKKYDPCALETPWGTRVETRSLHDLGAGGSGSSLVARAPDLIIICEPGFAPPETLPQARERLTTRRGRLWMPGTFEQANTWFVDIWRKWVRWPNSDMGKSYAVPSWLNTASFPGGRHDPEILAIEKSYATLKEFLVRWGGVPLTSDALVMGAYWDERKLVSDSATFQPYDKDGAKLPVYLMIDPGYNSKFAVLAAQRFGDHYNVFDEVVTRTAVHEEVIDQCRARPWWPNVVSGVIDPYAGGSHVYGAQAPTQIWWRYGRVPVALAPRLEVEEAVARLQHIMRDPQSGRPHVTISPECKVLRWEMAHWRRVRTREGLGRPSDIHCDAVKAMAYFMTAKYTESALGYGLGADPIVVRDWELGRRSGAQSVDRYRNYDRTRGLPVKEFFD